MKKILLSVAMLGFLLSSSNAQQRFVDDNNQQQIMNSLTEKVDEHGQRFIAQENHEQVISPIQRALRSEPWQDNLKEYNPFFTNAKEWSIPEMNFYPAANPQPAGDLNNDGFADFVTYNGICADERTATLDDKCYKSLIFFGNGTGGFDKQLEYRKITPAGDLNGDGFGDAFIQEYEKDCYLYTGSKDGFVLSNSTKTYNIYNVEYINIDVNNDGFNDCVFIDVNSKINVIYGSKDNTVITNVVIDTVDKGLFSLINVDGTYMLFYYFQYETLKTYQFDNKKFTENNYGYNFTDNYMLFDYIDIDNDGKCELISYSRYSDITIFKDYSVDSGLTQLDKITTNIKGIHIGDINNDQVPEFIIYKDTEKLIGNIDFQNGCYIYNSILIDFPIHFNYNRYYTMQTRCQIYDYNNDGKKELLVRSVSDNEYIYETIRTDNQKLIIGNNIKFNIDKNEGIFLDKTCNLGDNNGDGLDDIALYNNERIDIFTNGNLTTPAFSIKSESDKININKIAAADLNNDGFSDWIVSYKDYSNFENSRIDIYYGGSNISTTPAKQINIVNSLDITLDENAPTPEYGFNIIGSVDGDNYPEVIMFNTSDRDKNKVFIFKGAETFPDKPTTIMDFASNFGDVNIKSESDNGYIGSSAISLGDINNDGINDFVIADCLRRGADYNGINGCLFVFYGKTDLQFTTPEKILYNPNWDRSSSNFNLIYVYGMHLTSGDYNGDGVKDIAVSGTSFRDNNNNAAPGVDIYYGGNNISNIPNKRLYVKAKNNSTGEYSNLTSHGGLTTVPDIDGDKTDELIINLYKSDYSVGYLYLGSEGFNENPVAVINEATPLGGAISMNNYYYSRFPLPIAKFTNKNIPEFLSIRKDINYCGYTVALYRITDPANTAPFNIIIDNNTIKENSPANTKVGELDAIDHSILDYYTYKLIADGDGNSFDNELFAIEDNALYAKQSFDFEAKSSYNIFVEVIDASNATFQKQLVVNVEDVNEVPTAITLSNDVVAEDAAIGTEIGVLSATDVDANDVLTYTIADNENFKVEGDKLVTKSTFDYETKSEYKVIVTATDKGGLKVEKEFTITITKVKTTAIGKAVNANVKLYPNPAVTTITIETSVLINRVDIVNILGNVVYSQTVNATNITVDVSNLQSGIYNIKGYTSEGVITKKFVKR